MSASQNRKVKSISQNEYLYSGGYNKGDTCWRISEGYYIFFLKGSYTEGLGKILGYYFEFNESQPQHLEEDLVYYKKGSETWGIPIATDCFMLVGISPAAGKKVITVRIAPNPVETRAEIQISDLTENDNSWFVIRDFLGRTVMQHNLVSNPYTLNREGLPAGLYFLSVYNKNGFLQAWAKLIFK
ncbi:MAG TPA: T9SS type A sorting domain-containing protein [Bacteroidales bacterium]|nr:T9SS type A sorting domain-containing protein [Bacteroidales bacterium]